MVAERKQWAARPAPLVALSIAVLVAGCASTGPRLPDLPLDNWIELRAERFALIGNVPREELERMAEDLADYLAVVDLFTNAQTTRVASRFYVLQGEEWEVVVPRGIGGFIFTRLHGAYSAVRKSRGDAITRSTLLHEYTHFLIRKGRALRYPRWYDEGFAEFLGSTRRRGDSVTIGSPAPGRLQSLWYLDEIDVGPVLAAGPEEMWEIDAFYAISWALTHHLAVSAEGRRRMADMVANQTSGLEFEAAYARSFDIPVAALSARVAKHVEALQKGTLIPIEIAVSKLSPDLRWRLRPVTPPQAACELGEFALVMGDAKNDSKLARAFFDRALEIDPEHVRALAGRAVAEARLGRFSKAERDLERALVAAPDDVAVWRAAGHVHRRRALAAAADAEGGLADSERLRARQSYARALELAPSDVTAMAGIGWSYVGESDVGPGIDALEAARREGAWDAEVALDLGHLYMQRGSAERAGALWTEVVRVGDEDHVKEARRLLEESTEE